MIEGINYQVTQKCNINCAHCSFFCPLVPSDTKHKSIETIISDLALMSKFKDHLGILGLLGGEPFLHPEFSKILRISRRFFPKSRIIVQTNGSLANNILQWKDAIDETGAEITVSVYPYKKDPWEDFYKIKQVIPSAISWGYAIDHGFTINQLSNRTGDASPEQIQGCYKRWWCNQLKDGKLYLCHLIAYIDLLKKYFPGQVDMDVDDQCYIDLHDDNLTIEDIERWQDNAWPDICNHCLDAKYGNYAGPVEAWHRSERKIEEWIG